MRLTSLRNRYGHKEREGLGARGGEKQVLMNSRCRNVENGPKKRPVKPHRSPKSFHVAYTHTDKSHELNRPTDRPADQPSEWAPARQPTNRSVSFSSPIFLGNRDKKGKSKGGKGWKIWNERKWSYSAGGVSDERVQGRWRALAGIFFGWFGCH